MPFAHHLCDVGHFKRRLHTERWCLANSCGFVYNGSCFKVHAPPTRQLPCGCIIMEIYVSVGSIIWQVGFVKHTHLACTQKCIVGVQTIICDLNIRVFKSSILRAGESTRITII